MPLFNRVSSEKPMPIYIENKRLTKVGTHLVQLINQHIAAKSGMTEELRHYTAAVYKARLMKPAQWLEQYPDKADVLWSTFASEISEDEDQPPTSGIQPWLISK